MTKPLLEILHLGKIHYKKALELQKTLAQQIAEQRTASLQPVNKLLLLEHFPIYTVGIRSKEYTEELERDLRATGADFHRTNRGGLITFHGPGQLVAYPLISLKDFKIGVKDYVCMLEKTLMDTCASFGLHGYTNEHVGVWVNDKKIAAIGIKASRYVTQHGVALNCDTDMTWFQHIEPCGIKHKEATSLSQQLGRCVKVADVIPVFVGAFKGVFGCGYVGE